MLMVYINAAPQTTEAGKFSEFGNISCEDELARLDIFAVEYSDNPDMRLYVIVYAARRTQRKEAFARAVRIKQYLRDRRGVDSAKITIVQGGYRRDAWTELWFVPLGAQPPVPKPTVSPKHVKFLKGKSDLIFDCEAGLP